MRQITLIFTHTCSKIMGSVDKAAIVWTIAIVLIGASVAIVGSNFDQARLKTRYENDGQHE